ncbi:hypothetical protein Tco_1195755 [Tanacetum coccineum]
MKSYVLSFAHQADYAYTLMMLKTCMQIDRSMLWKEMTVRWQFAKYQEKSEQTGHKKRRLWPYVKIQTQKPLVATYNNEKSTEYHKEFDAEPTLCTLDKRWTWRDFATGATKQMNTVSLCLDGYNLQRDFNYNEKQKEQDQVLKRKQMISSDLGLNLGIDELAIRNKVVNQENTKSSQPEIDKNKVIIEDWVDSDDEETALNFLEIQKQTILNSENSETSLENMSLKSQNNVGLGSRKKGLGHKGGKTCLVMYIPDPPNQRL